MNIYIDTQARNNWAYGVLSHANGFIETSNTERGAKRKATNDGYLEVYRMHRVSWAVLKVAEKVNKKWINV